MSKVTFFGAPAWVGALRSPTVCEFWTSDPAQSNFDPALLSRVDLSLTPAAAIAGRIKVSQIEVDDFAASGGRTTIGPLWPSGTMIGALWLSDIGLNKLAAKAKRGVPAGTNGFDYEFTTVQYFEGEQHNRRFYGFHANVVQSQNNLSLVQLWNPGTGAGGGKPAGAWWLDLKADADPNTPPLTPGKAGPVFLDVTTVRLITTFEPKLPPFHGCFALAA